MVYDKYNNKELREYITKLSSDKMKKDNDIVCLRNEVEDLQKMLDTKDTIILDLRDKVNRLEEENKALKLDLVNKNIANRKREIRGMKEPYV